MRDHHHARFIFFSALLATALSLECEVCSGIGSTCYGKTKTCAIGQDTCIVTIFENISDGMAVQSVSKGCESSDVCSSPEMHLNLGHGKVFTLSTVCCKEGTCGQISPKLAPQDNQINGIQCPACYDITDECKKEKVACTGSDMYCFDLTLGLQSNGRAENITMKGCTTRYACNKMNDGKFFMFRDQGAIVGRARCGSGRSQAPQTSEVLLSSFALILLTMKIFT